MADCSNLIANMCGDRGVAMPEAPCKQLRLEGVDDVTINQGIGIDLADGVHAYDGDGNEIEVVIDPNEIDKCDVGIHSVKYTAVGKADTMRPTLCGTNAIHTSEDCEDLTSIEAVRTVTIEQIDPPTISGVSDTMVASGTNFNPMDGVSAVDGNGNSVDVEFEGEYPASASGKIATFNNESNKPLRSLKVALSPIQDLHGYDHPWAGGAGVNLMPYLAERTVTYNGVTFVSDGKGTVTITGTATGADYATMTCPTFTIPDGSVYKVCFLNKQATAAGIEFYNGNTYVDQWSLSTVNKSAPYSAMSGKQCDRVRFKISNGETYDQSISIMFVPQSTDASSYIPYSNICPISGHTECVTNVSGANLLDTSENTNESINNQGVVSPSDTRVLTKYIKVKPNTEYRYSSSASLYGSIIAAFDANKNFLGFKYAPIHDPDAPISFYFDTGNDIKYVRATYGKELTDVMLAFATEGFIPSYEPYEGQTYHTDIGQTVYGGTLDVVSGKLEVTWKTRVISASEITQADTTRPANQMYLFDMSADDENRVELGRYALVVADRLVRSTSQFPNVGEIADGSIVADRTKYLAMLATTDLATARQQLDGMVIAYPLVEPEVYQLTPQQINAFIGVNNVWADDSDNVEVVYTKALPQSGSVTLLDGVYYITYTAEDECGNKTEVTRRIVVGDGNKLCKMRLCEGFADCSQNRTCEAYTCRAYTACE